MTYVRRAGHLSLADGRSVTWSVADGRRGRRWRSTTSSSNGEIESVVLLELTPNGALSKLELAAPNGLLSLHPEGPSLHGNSVRADGVRHLRFDWSAAHGLILEGSAVPVLAAPRSAVPATVGERLVISAIVVRPDLDVAPASVTLKGLGPNSVEFEVHGERRVLKLDDDRIPTELRGGGDWPLELE